MPIILKPVGEFSPKNESGRTANIKISSNGTVTGNFPINLGNQGDDGVTILYIELPEEVTSKYQENLYKTYLKVKAQNFYNTFEVNGAINNNKQELIIPAEMSLFLKDKNLTLTYIIQEIDEKGENLEDKKEVFASSDFQATFNLNFYSSINEENAETHNFDDNFGITKAPILLDYEGKVNSGSTNKILGYKEDNYITYVELSNYPFSIAEAESAARSSYIFFKQSDVIVGSTFYTVNNKSLAWIPYSVTSRVGNWDILIIIYDESGDRYISNQFTMAVLDNSLEPYSVIVDENNVPLYDENNLQLLANETNDFYTKLSFTGQEIDEILTKAKDIDTDTIEKDIINNSYKNLFTENTNQIDSKFLPSYVDDVIEFKKIVNGSTWLDKTLETDNGTLVFNNTAAGNLTGGTSSPYYHKFLLNTNGEEEGVQIIDPEKGKIYVNTSTTNSTVYRWSGANLVVISQQDLSDYYKKSEVYNKNEIDTKTEDINKNYTKLLNKIETLETKLASLTAEQLQAISEFIDGNAILDSNK